MIEPQTEAEHNPQSTVEETAGPPGVYCGITWENPKGDHASDRSGH